MNLKKKRPCDRDRPELSHHTIVSAVTAGAWTVFPGGGGACWSQMGLKPGQEAWARYSPSLIRSVLIFPASAIIVTGQRAAKTTQHEPEVNQAALRVPNYAKITHKYSESRTRQSSPPFTSVACFSLYRTVHRNTQFWPSVRCDAHWHTRLCVCVCVFLELSSDQSLELQSSQK